MNTAAARNNPAAVTLSAAAVMLVLLLTSSCSYTSSDMSMHIPASAPVHGIAGHKISALELHRLLNDHFGGIYIKLSDSNYTLPDNSQVAELTRMQPRDNWDSADYAIAAMVPLRNYAFGAMYVPGSDGSREVINVFVNRNKEIVYWEALNGRSYTGQLQKPELIVF